MENGIYFGDANVLSLEIPDNSVDLIFTDPIYSNIEDYEWLAKLGQRVLKPGKSLMAMAGNLEKPRIYDVMRPYLDYHWEAAVIYRGANFFMNSRAIQVSWKPILWFTKGKREPKWCKDALTESCYPKQHGRYQQSPTSAIWFIRQLTYPNNIILDPFCGFGTFPVACKTLHRHYLGFEINPNATTIARQRLSQLSPLPLPPITQQLNLV